jgi:hypothetical protein
MNLRLMMAQNFHDRLIPRSYSTFYTLAHFHRYHLMRYTSQSPNNRQNYYELQLVKMSKNHQIHMMVPEH